MDALQEAVMDDLDTLDLTGESDGELIDIAMGANPIGFDLEDELDEEALYEAYDENKNNIF